MFGVGNGGRIRGRPRRRWMDEVIEATGLQLQQLKEACICSLTQSAMGWRQWRDVVKIVTRGRLRLDETR